MLKLSEPYAGRLRLLADELEKLDDGFIHMGTWFPFAGIPRWNDLEPPASELRRLAEEAEAYPCGTACCLAGKAALMPVFREQGFYLTIINRSGSDGAGFQFSMPARQFFGNEAYSAVLTGSWAIANLWTPAQAVVLLRAFLESDYEEIVRLGPAWEPSEEVWQRISELAPETDWALFPVSGVRVRMTAGGAYEYATLT